MNTKKRISQIRKIEKLTEEITKLVTEMPNDYSSTPRISFTACRWTKDGMEQIWTGRPTIEITTCDGHENFETWRINWRDFEQKLLRDLDFIDEYSLLAKCMERTAKKALARGRELRELLEEDKKEGNEQSPTAAG